MKPDTNSSAALICILLCVVVYAIFIMNYSIPIMLHLAVLLAVGFICYAVHQRRQINLAEELAVLVRETNHRFDFEVIIREYCVNYF